MCSECVTLGRFAYAMAQSVSSGATSKMDSMFKIVQNNQLGLGTR